MALVVALLVAHARSSAFPRFEPTADGIGIVNVTAPPFSVDPSGTTDVTLSLQRAIDAAKAANLALFLPAGRYLVSDTLACDQINWAGGDGQINIVPDRFRAHVILGSSAALPAARPTIVLAPRTPGFGNASSPKSVMRIHNPGNENINMNQVIRGVDFEVGAGNPGAIALVRSDSSALSPSTALAQLSAPQWFWLTG